MDEITFHDNVPATQTSEVFKSEKRWLLFVYIPIFVTVGSVIGIIFDNHKDFSRLVDVILTLGLNIFSFAWCRMDSRERGYELHRYFPFAVIIFGTFALLYYLFRSRGFRGGLISIGWLILYAVLVVVAASIIVGVIVTALVLVGVVPSAILD